MNKFKIILLIISIFIQICLLLGFFYGKSEIFLIVNNFFILVNIQILSQIIDSQPSTISYKIFTLFWYGLLFIILSGCTIIRGIYLSGGKLSSILCLIIPTIIGFLVDLGFKRIALRKNKAKSENKDIIDGIIIIFISCCVITTIAIYNHRGYNDEISLLVSITKLIFK